MPKMTLCYKDRPKRMEKVLLESLDGLSRNATDTDLTSAA